MHDFVDDRLRDSDDTDLSDARLDPHLLRERSPRPYAVA